MSVLFLLFLSLVSLSSPKVFHVDLRRHPPRSGIRQQQQQQQQTCWDPLVVAVDAQGVSFCGGVLGRPGGDDDLLRERPSEAMNQHQVAL